MSRNDNFSAAKRAKNDEFYTQREDIGAELLHYMPHFKDKVVYCNCDDPDKSEFWKFFESVFDKWGLKKLIATHYNPGAESYSYEIGADHRVVKTLLPCNGDFRSAACVELLKEADIVVTNPPFSLFREYVALLMKYEKKFLIIGSMNAITYKEIFPLLKDNKIWLGYHHPKRFIQPDGTVRSFGNILWYTNLDIEKRHEPLDLHENHYIGNEDKYPKYDNYDAINVDKVADIPCDYYECIGVPITFLEKYCPEQFKIVGFTSGQNDFDECAWPIKRYSDPIQVNRDGSEINGSKANTRPMILVDKKPSGIYYLAPESSGYLVASYARILIRVRLH